MHINSLHCNKIYLNLPLRTILHFSNKPIGFFFASLLLLVYNDGTKFSYFFRIVYVRSVVTLYIRIFVTYVKKVQIKHKLIRNYSNVKMMIMLSVSYRLLTRTHHNTVLYAREKRFRFLFVLFKKV